MSFTIALNYTDALLGSPDLLGKRLTTLDPGARRVMIVNTHASPAENARSNCRDFSCALGCYPVVSEEGVNRRREEAFVQAMRRSYK